MTCKEMSSLKEAKDTFQSLMELSRLLCTGLEPDILAICVRLCEAGLNPQMLALVLNELRKEVQNIQDHSMNDAEN